MLFAVGFVQAVFLVLLIKFLLFHAYLGYTGISTYEHIRRQNLAKVVKRNRVLPADRNNQSQDPLQESPNDNNSIKSFLRLNDSFQRGQPHGSPNGNPTPDKLENTVNFSSAIKEPNQIPDHLVSELKSVSKHVLKSKEEMREFIEISDLDSRFPYNRREVDMTEEAVQGTDQIHSPLRKPPLFPQRQLLTGRQAEGANAEEQKEAHFEEDDGHRLKHYQKSKTKDDNLHDEEDIFKTHDEGPDRLSKTNKEATTGANFNRKNTSANRLHTFNNK